MTQSSQSTKAQQGEAPPVFTIGHSTRTIAEFVTLLRAGQVQLVVDIRRMPRSRANPQYNIEVLPAELADHQIGYMRIAELGGLHKTIDMPPDVNGFWTNRSFHNYADYALTDEFQRGFDCLLDASSGQRAAIMCAEAVWWRCHRRIVADYLINVGRTVYHLMGTDEVQPAELTSAAVRAGDRLHYPASTPSDGLSATKPHCGLGANDGYRSARPMGRSICKAGTRRMKRAMTRE